MHLKCKKTLKLLFIAIVLNFSTSDGRSFFSKFCKQYLVPEGIVICREFAKEQSKLLANVNRIDGTIRAVQDVLELPAYKELSCNPGYKDLDIISPPAAEKLPFIDCGKIKGPCTYPTYQTTINYWREELKILNKEKSQNIFEIASQKEILIGGLEKSVSKNYCALKIGIVVLCLNLFMQAKNLDSGTFSPKVLSLLTMPYDFFCSYLLVTGFVGAVVNNRLLRLARKLYVQV